MITYDLREPTPEPMRSGFEPDLLGHEGVPQRVNSTFGTLRQPSRSVEGHAHTLSRVAPSKTGSNPVPCLTSGEHRRIRKSSSSRSTDVQL